MSTSPPPTTTPPDSQKLLPTTPPSHEPPLTNSSSITPHRLRSQLLVHNLKTSGILPHDHAHRSARLTHSARGLEAIGFDENASMYASYKGEREGEGWGAAWKGSGEEGKEGKKGAVGGKRRFLKKLVGKGEDKGEKL